MGLDRTLHVRPSTFSANSKVYSAGPEGLANQLRTVQAMFASGLAIEGGSLSASGTPAPDLAADSSNAIAPIITFDATGGFVEGMISFADEVVLGVESGHPIIFQNEGGAVPTGLVEGTEYFIIRVQGSGQAGTKDPNRVQLAASKLQAEQGVAIELTGDGTGTTYVAHQIVMPGRLTLHDSLGDTTAVLETQANVTADTILEACASIVNILNPMRADIGMDEPTEGDLTGSNTVAAFDLGATANSTDDNAVLYDDAVVIKGEVEDAIKTVALNINDVAAAVGQDEYLDFLSPGAGVETSDGNIDDSTAAATGGTDSAGSSVAVTQWDLQLVIWGSALHQLLTRLSVVGAAAGVADYWTQQLMPPATEVLQVLPGLRTRNRLIGGITS